MYSTSSYTIKVGYVNCKSFNRKERSSHKKVLIDGNVFKFTLKLALQFVASVYFICHELCVKLPTVLVLIDFGCFVYFPFAFAIITTFVQSCKHWK